MAWASVHGGTDPRPTCLHPNMFGVAEITTPRIGSMPERGDLAYNTAPERPDVWSPFGSVFSALSPIRPDSVT
ncbi:hypothetical protein JCM17092_15330 [Haloplanus litoreus]